MSTTLTQAFQQWASRPADQRFSSLEAIHAAVSHHREIAREATNVDLRTLRVSPIDVMDNGKIVARTPMLAAPSGQDGEPHALLVWPGGPPHRRSSELPPRAAGRSRGREPEQRAPEVGGRRRTTSSSHKTAVSLSARRSPRSTRASGTRHHEPLDSLDANSPEWQPAPAAFDGSRGLYASDRDMFAFLVDNDRRIFEKGPAVGSVAGSSSGTPRSATRASA
jgi:hypothetical protein